jgi:hypothetical protein
MWEKREVLLGTTWGTLWELHGNMIGTRGEKKKKQKSISPN